MATPILPPASSLPSVFSQAPVGIAVLRGREQRYEVANELFLRISGKESLVGRTVREVFPELEGQGMLELLDRTFTTGEPFVGRGVSLRLDRGRGLEDCVVDFTYQPLREADDTISGIVVLAADMTEQARAQTLLARRATHLALSAEVGAILAKTRSLPEMLQRCAEAIQRQLDTAFARVWTLNEKEQVLELRASAGLYTHLDGPHGRVPVGMFKIGRIAKTREPHLTNDVQNDPHVGNHEWARREGMVAFGGYPLLVDDRVIGVVAFFARRELAQDSFEALAAVADMIATGVDRKLAEEEQRRLIVLLERSNKDLDQFAYVASHDLKAPLRGIANLSEWLEEDLGAAVDGPARDKLQKLRGRVHRMEALIDGILDYSRAGRARHKPERIEVQRLLAEVTDLLAPGSSAVVAVSQGMPTLTTEKVALQQVFMNLIGNALKHARRADPLVEVKVQENVGEYRFTVSDNGQGIAPEFHERIWGIFQTLEARDKVEGAGIGLAVVKKIVESRGGSTWVESAAGAGASFHFTWPKFERPEDYR